MPSQFDLETLAIPCTGRGNDRKVACDTLADEGSDEESPEYGVMLDEDYADVHLDFPPESFWLSKDAEYDWFDRNAFLDRKDSTKGISYSNSHIKLSNSNQNSQRFSVNLKNKASIIGLPKTQKATFADSGRRTCKSVNIKLFPNRSTSVGAFAEPGSPKVSCIGRVRSKRCRRPRSNAVKRSDKPVEKPKTGREKPVEKPKTTGVGKKKKARFYSKVMNIFRSKKAHKRPPRSGSRKVAEETPASASSQPLRRSVSYKAVSEPPSLGGMQRFASGRRLGSFTAEDLNQVVLEPLDIDRRVWVVGKR